MFVCAAFFFLSFFFYFFDRCKVYIKCIKRGDTKRITTRAPQSIQGGYTRGTKEKQKKKIPNLSHSYFKPNQSTKSNIDINVSHMQCLTQSKNLHIEQGLSNCFEISTLSKAFKFLTCQIVQIKGTNGQPTMLSYTSSRKSVYSNLTTIILQRRRSHLANPK